MGNRQGAWIREGLQGLAPWLAQGGSPVALNKWPELIGLASIGAWPPGVHQALGLMSSDTCWVRTHFSGAAPEADTHKPESQCNNELISIIWDDINLRFFICTMWLPNLLNSELFWRWRDYIHLSCFLIFLKHGFCRVAPAQKPPCFRKVRVQHFCVKLRIYTQVTFPISFSTYSINTNRLQVVVHYLEIHLDYLYLYAFVHAVFSPLKLLKERSCMPFYLLVQNPHRHQASDDATLPSAPSSEL